MANLGNTTIFGELKVALNAKVKTINDWLCPTQVNLAAVDANNNYMEGRGLVVGYSGDDYPGIGYNVRHTTTGGSFIVPRADTASYMFFRNGGFQFGGVGAQTAGATVSFSVNAEITKEGNINSFRLLPASNINSATYNNAAIEIRELNKAGLQTDTIAIAPRLAFHWAGRVASQIVLRPDGKIAIMNNPGTNYEGLVVGRLESAGDVIAFASDERLKTEFTKIENSLEITKQLDVGYYSFNELGESFGFSSKDVHIGIKAGQANKLLKGVTALAPFDNKNGESKSGENYLTVKYEKLTPLLLQNIKDLIEKIDMLEKKINDKNL